ncbi:TrkH family potassium uptake protein [Calditerricola yamamurae]
MPEMKSVFHVQPAKLLALGFIALILLGAFLLWLPVSTHEGLSFIDALFTATSAVCVTGLSVVDTPTTFTAFGKLVIMLLVQVGGIGFVTIAILIAVLLGRRIGLRERLVLQEAYGQVSLSGLIRLTQQIALITVVVEGCGAFLLAARFIPEYGVGSGLFYGLFHAVSAFNNAGFALWSDNLMGFAHDASVLLVIGTLVIVGGVGYTVILDVVRKKHMRRLSLHSKMMLIGTAALLIVSTLGYLALEWANPKTLGPMGWGDKWLNAFFMAVVPRTAGFNSVDMTGLTDSSVYWTMLLMFIGGGPGSTAGGIKVTTLIVLILAVWSVLARREDVQAMGRRISRDVVFRALAIVFFGGTIVFTGSFLLTLTEPEGVGFHKLLFETVSAFGTVGLSLNFTPHLSPLGKLVIIVIMFLGRVGPLTVAYALAIPPRAKPVRYPKEDVLVG